MRQVGKLLVVCYLDSEWDPHPQPRGGTERRRSGRVHRRARRRLRRNRPRGRRALAAARHDPRRNGERRRLCDVRRKPRQRRHLLPGRRGRRRSGRPHTLAARGEPLLDRRRDGARDAGERAARRAHRRARAALRAGARHGSGGARRDCGGPRARRKPGDVVMREIVELRANADAIARTHALPQARLEAGLADLRALPSEHVLAPVLAAGTPKACSRVSRSRAP
ncbi:hypothetical protein BDAG_02018 [Burkholderia dolosa AU0158]|nr:hypothetical protein BDAG_02018 [Burkholderia dolosa AU0158]